MAWLEVHQALRDHRKTWALAAELDMPEAHVSGHLIYLWLWGLDNAQEGKLPANVRLIERAAGWVGESGVFVRALMSTGFIDESDDGSLYLHDWDIYAGKLISKRMADAQRKRDERRSASRPTDIHRTSDGHLSDGAGTNQQTNQHTEPNQPVHTSQSDGAATADALPQESPTSGKPAKEPKPKRTPRYSGDEQAYVAQLLTGVRAINGTRGALPTEGRERDAGHWFYRANDGQPAPVDDVLDLYRTVKARAFWQGKYLSLQTLEAEWTEYQRDPTAYRNADKPKPDRTWLKPTGTEGAAHFRKAEDTDPWRD